MLLRVLLCSAAAALWLHARPCEALKSFTLPNTEITAAESLSGDWTPPGAAKPLTGLPAFCRVAGVIRPSSDSHIEFEVWLPAANWNGKFQGIGNGGFAGAISYGPPGLATAITLGYAAASTDTGHKGSSTDASWALNHPEKIIDFGHRAIHLMTINAKAVVEAFYGKPPRRSYFAACSNGGRQALMEAQRYPGDYDGIIAAAPANAWTDTMSGFVWNTQALLAPGAHIPPAKLPAIEAAVIAACDARDGAQDRALADPRNCRFDPQSMLCRERETEACLTAPQIAALRRIYSGPPNFPGFEPGAETGGGGWQTWITGAAAGRSIQAIFARQFAENMVYNKPAFDFGAFDFTRDPQLVRERMAAVLNATNPDLRAFHRRGGKLILFHGWNDPALPARNTISYYEAVRSTMGSAVAGEFVRLYMVPGLQHCFGGIGPTYCGGLGPAMRDPLHDLSATLERWVEQGVPPGAVVATAGPGAADKSTRLICVYPEVAVYKGSGAIEDAASFRCSRP